MNTLFAVRAGIFFIAGLLVIIFPKQIYKFQTYVLRKLRIKHDPRRDLKHNFHAGIFFIIIAIGLFIYAIK